MGKDAFMTKNHLWAAVLLLTALSGVTHAQQPAETDLPLIESPVAPAIETMATTEPSTTESSPQEPVSDSSALESNTNSQDKVEVSSPETWQLSVSNDDTVRIGKIYEFLNDPAITKVGKDHSLKYEFKYFNHGAITKAQLHNRKGHYYVVTWKNFGAAADYQLRFDYRQSRTREKVHTQIIDYPGATGNFKGTFSVTGAPYFENGAILSWRISLVRNGVIVAEKKSFVW